MSTILTTTMKNTAKSTSEKTISQEHQSFAQVLPIFSTLKEILSSNELQHIELEFTFFNKLRDYKANSIKIETNPANFLDASLNTDDFQREPAPLTVFASYNKKYLLQPNSGCNQLQEVTHTYTEIPTKSNTFKLHILPASVSQPDYVYLQFITNPQHCFYKIHDEKIILLSDYIESPNVKHSLKKEEALENLLQVAVALSRWPFLKVKWDEKEFFILKQLENKQEALSYFPYYKRRHFFNQILLGRRPSAGLLFLDKMKVLDVFLPEITDGHNLTQNRFHAYDIFEHSIRALDGVMKPDIGLKWSALLHDVGKVPTRQEKPNGEASFHNHEIYSARMAVSVMKRIGIPKSIGQRVKFLIRNHMFHYTHKWTDKAIRRFIRKIDNQDLEDLIDLRLADRKGSGKKTEFPQGLVKLMEHIAQVKQKEKELKVTDLTINGWDLIEIGVPPGPEMGRILKQILLKVKNDNLPNQREILLNEAKKIQK